MAVAVDHSSDMWQWLWLRLYFRHIEWRIIWCIGMLIVTNIPPVMRLTTNGKMVVTPHLYILVRLDGINQSMEHNDR